MNYCATFPKNHEIKEFLQEEHEKNQLMQDVGTCFNTGTHAREQQM